MLAQVVSCRYRSNFLCFVGIHVGLAYEVGAGHGCHRPRKLCEARAGNKANRGGSPQLAAAQLRQ